MGTKLPSGLKLLAAFIEQRSTQAQFAKAVSCSASHLSLVLKGKRGVSLGLAKRIADETCGFVPMESLAGEARRAA